MTDDTYIITGFSTHDDAPTVQINYQVWGQQYDTELFLEALTGAAAPSPEQLQSALSEWVVNEAKPQLAPPAPIVSESLQALVEEAPTPEVL